MLTVQGDSQTICADVPGRTQAIADSYAKQLQSLAVSSDGSHLTLAVRLYFQILASRLL